MIWRLVALETAIFVLVGGVLVDIAAHRRDDPYVINQFGYRGPPRVAKRPGELRVVIVGGSAAFAAGTPFLSTLGPELARAMNRLTGKTADDPFADVLNVAEP